MPRELLASMLCFDCEFAAYRGKEGLGFALAGSRHDLPILLIAQDRADRLRLMATGWIESIGLPEGTSADVLDRDQGE
jgi:hypothetical protein